MNQNFYVSDLHQHFGHTNVLKFDKRPWESIEDMDNVLINNWNEVVSNSDTVYICGDFCWQTEDRWIEILEYLL